tara:strand:- start:134 stop:415 length:282 start_codon:yes stop_codon:yes gene_type:complete
MKRKVNIRKIVDEYLKQNIKRKKVKEKKRKLLIDLIKQIIIFLLKKDVIELIRNILTISLLSWILWYETKIESKKKADDEYLLKFQYHLQEQE